jgi:hypothetical protein
MTADDLSAPLGLAPKRRRYRINIPVPKIIAGALALFLGAFVLWAVVADDPFGGEPIAVVPANLQLAAKPPDASGAPPPPPTALSDAAQHHDIAAAPPAPAPPPAAPANTTTVTIIDGKTGAKQDVLVAAPANTAASANATASVNGAASTDAVPLDQKFAEMTAHGSVPKIAADGTRPADAFARPVQPIPGKPDAPRIALIVGGLGVSASATADAIAKLPGPVTLGFVPYGSDLA